MHDLTNENNLKLILKHHKQLSKHISAKKNNLALMLQELKKNKTQK